jgi:hypothetical protein
VVTGASLLTLPFSKPQLSFRKLRELHAVTDEEDDAQAQDFVETRLTDQVPAPLCGNTNLLHLGLCLHCTCTPSASE